jgi:hypothetical protein
VTSGGAHDGLDKPSGNIFFQGQVTGLWHTGDEEKAEVTLEKFPLTFQDFIMYYYNILQRMNSKQRTRRGHE